MGSVQVKICGITNPSDARWAENLGVDYIGLNFSPASPRKISADMGAEITEHCPPFVKKVGVFVNPTVEELEKIFKKVKLDVIQLHGDETPDQVSEIKSKFGKSVWKAVRVENADSIAKLSDYAGIADLVLLDAYVPEQNGGTGKTFNWDLVNSAKDAGIPLAVAGGLNPENVKEAIKKTMPKLVDTASGVEKDGHPRKKDLDKMKQFVMNAKKA